MTTFHGKLLSFPLVLSQKILVSKIILSSDSLGVVFSEARRIGSDWGETNSGAQSERNLRPLKGWRGKFLKTKREEFRVCCKSEANELAENKPKSEDLRN